MRDLKIPLKVLSWKSCLWHGLPYFSSWWSIWFFFQPCQQLSPIGMTSVRSPLKSVTLSWYGCWRWILMKSIQLCVIIWIPNSIGLDYIVPNDMYIQWSLSKHAILLSFLDNVLNSSSNPSTNSHSYIGVWVKWRCFSGDGVQASPGIQYLFGPWESWVQCAEFFNLTSKCAIVGEHLISMFLLKAWVCPHFSGGSLNVFWYRHLR